MKDVFLTERKLKKRLEEVADYRYRDIFPVSRFYMKKDEKKLPVPELPEEYSEGEVFSKGDTWNARDGYLWLYTEVTIPEEWDGRRVLGFFDFGRYQPEEYGHFEAMCYLNGILYTGVDQNHREVFLEKESAGKIYGITLRLWSGLEGGGEPKIQELRFREAFLAWLDEKADDFYYLGNMILETIRVLGEGNPTAYALRRILDQASRMLDWSEPGSERFYQTLYMADDFLNKEIDSMEADSPVKVRCVGHTHIDMAWLWRLKHAREKGARSFATVLRMMEMFPEYIFLQSQPRLYEYIKEDFPQLYEQIRNRIKEGRWEADGAMWVEADCNLTSGESLTRQILLGTGFMEREFGKKPEFLWLPDVFGYSWALPQILRKSGIQTFMTTKISWNQYNRMPHDTFWWKGMDGTQILTHFITTPDPGKAEECFQYTYNGTLLPETVKGVWDTYSDKNMNQELLLCYGHGDGGGGVSRDMLERRRRINKIPGLPKLETSSAGEYFRNLHRTVEETREYVHTWDGELYLEYHRGTYTSQAYNKRMNRKMEFLYRRVEWLTVMNAVTSGSLAMAEQEKLTTGWKLLLTNQFHDIIPGSSIREVYEDSQKDYEEIKRIGCEAEENALKGLLSQEKKAWTVFNASAWELDELVLIPEQVQCIYKDENGRVCESQQVTGGMLVKADQVPAMGCKTLYAEPESGRKQWENCFSLEDFVAETPFYKIVFNKQGQIERLYDKTYARDVLPEGERANVLQVFEDKPLDFDAWDIDIFYQEKMQEITELTSFTVKETGNLRMVIEMKWVFGQSAVCQELVLYKYSRRIDFHTTVDFHERHRLVKAAFPVDVRTTFGIYDIQYGNVKRANNWNTSWEQAKFESVAHRFVDLSQREYGVSLLNDCKYGHDIKENVIRITLLKSAVYPDYEQDQGFHEFTYSLLPHGGDFIEGKTVLHAHQLNAPMKVAKGESGLSGKSFFRLSCPDVEVDAVKKAENGQYLVIRFHEFTGARRNVVLTPEFAYTCWAEGNLMEEPQEPFRTDQIAVEIKPYEIKTILLK